MIESNYRTLSFRALFRWLISDPLKFRITVQRSFDSYSVVMKQNALIIFVWFGLLILTLLYFMIYQNFSQDDAYITFRYARNLSSGAGFVYNPGEWVLGTTTPLFTVLLALLAALTKLDVVVVSIMVCFISLWLSSCLMFEIGRPISLAFGIASALLFLTNPFLPHFMGMESYFLLCLFLITVHAYEKGKSLTTAIGSGLLILIRYEMVLFLVIVALVDLFRKKKIPFWLTPGLVPVLIWMIYAWQMFGSTVPLSASAKLAATNTPFLLGFTGYIYSFVNRIPGWFLIIVLFLTGIGSIYFNKRFLRKTLLLILFSSIYLVISSIIAGSFPWYYAPLIPLFSFFTTAGIQYIASVPLGSTAQDHRLKGAIYRGIFSLLLAAAFLIQVSFWHKDIVAYNGRSFDHRYEAYTQICNWLTQNARQEKSIAALEIGYIGYYTDMKMIDLHGLITPRLLPWVGSGSEVTLIQSLQLFTPDYVIIPVEKAPLIQVMEHDTRYRLENVFGDRYHLFLRK